MAYSHTESTYGGTLGAGYRVNADTDILSQDEENNRTLVRFYGYMTKAGGTSAWNLDPTYCNIQPDGVLVNGNVNGYDGRAGSGPWYGITYDAWIYHNSDGTRNVQAYFYHDAGNSPYLTTGWCVQSVALPAHYRYADPSSVTFSNITDVGFTINMTANRVCSRMEVSLDNGASYPYVATGSFSSTSLAIGGVSAPLKSGFTYDQIKVKLRRQASGFDKIAGNYSTSTLTQNRFFGRGIGTL